MPLQNRSDPFGALHAVTDRGLLMGNRGGCFHRDDQTLKERRWASRRWIVCVLSFKDRRRKLMQPGLYTEIFFLDEATALASGHRPCFECRRAEAAAFRNGMLRPVTCRPVNPSMRSTPLQRAKSRAFSAALKPANRSPLHPFPMARCMRQAARPG